MSQPYRLLGLGLIMAGVLFTPVCYFLLESAALTSVGISMLILGFTCLALANTRPYISPEACQVMLRTGMENTSALLEELGLRNKAIYLPSSLRDGKPQAIIPLTEGEAQNVRGKIPGRLVVRYGNAPEDMAIAVTTPGSLNLDMLETPPGPTSGELEAAISYILIGILDLASSVSVALTDSRVDVEISNPRLQWEDIWYYRALGSPLASIAAAVACEGLGKPVQVIEEHSEENKTRIEIGVAG
ncbi:MAG: hypothetical protein ACLFVK_03650 [Dehalococcoidia bacterium]